MPLDIERLPLERPGRTFPVDDPEGYRLWASERQWCHCCGIDADLAVFAYAGIPLSTHHIVKAGRSDEACNLLRLCGRCHDLAEGRNLRVASVLLPHLTIAVCLTIKATRDAEAHDPARLAVLFGRRLPDPEPIPPVFEWEFRKRRPWDVRRFFGPVDVGNTLRAP